MKDVSFQVDGLSLKANLFFPQKEQIKNPAVLFTHGWTSEKKRYFQYAEALKNLGYTVMVFDMRGHGVSEGDINVATPEEFLRDCIAAYDYLASIPSVDNEHISIAGSSFGGYLGSILTSKRNVKNLALRVPADYSNDSLTKPKMGNAGENPEVFQWRLIPKKYTDTLAYEALHKYDGNILIIESEKDDVVPHQSIQNYIDAVKDRKKLTYIILKNAPHSIPEGPFRDEVTRILVNWFKDRINS